MADLYDVALGVKGKERLAMARLGPRLNLLTALFAVLTLAAPATAQDVFNGNGNDGVQQQNGDPGGVGGDTTSGRRTQRPLPGLKYCPQYNGYLYDMRLCGHIEEQGLQPPPPIDANPCQPGGRGGYDWRNNAAGTPMPTECSDYIAAERRAGRSGVPHRYTGGKSLGRRPPQSDQISPEQHISRPFEFERIDQAIDACFKKYLPGYKHPDWALLPKYQLDPISEKMTPSSLFYVARMGADEALPLLKPNDVGRAQELDLDYLTGWVIGCLWEREVLPPRDLRMEFMNWNKAVHPSETWYSFNERENRYRLGTVERTLRPFAHRTKYSRRAQRLTP